MTTARATPSHAFPEQVDWRDTGCEEAPACLRCPLHQCKHDDPGWLASGRRALRDQEIMQAVAGRSVGDVADEIGERFRVSARTVYRVVKSTKDGKR